MNTIDHATLAALIAGIDKTARDHEREWGIDRLPTLVDDDLRAKFYRQRAKWSEAIERAYDSGDRPLTPDRLETIQALGDGLKRGWAAMASTASGEGHRPISAEVWEMTLQDGSKAALVRSTAEAGYLVDEGRYKAVWTLDEIANVIAINLTAAFVEAKTVWPGAVIMRPTTPLTREGDDLPFGDELPVVNGRTLDLEAEFG